MNDTRVVSVVSSCDYDSDRFGTRPHLPAVVSALSGPVRSHDGMMRAADHTGTPHHAPLMHRRASQRGASYRGQVRVAGFVSGPAATRTTPPFLQGPLAKGPQVMSLEPTTTPGCTRAPGPCRRLAAPQGAVPPSPLGRGVSPRVQQLRLRGVVRYLQPTLNRDVQVVQAGGRACARCR